MFNLQDFRKLSSMKQIKKNLRASVSTIENKSNIFFSSEHVERLPKNIDQKNSTNKIHLN